MQRMSEKEWFLSLYNTDDVIEQKMTNLEFQLMYDMMTLLSKIKD